MPLRLVLASASPARRKSLQAAGIEPDVLVSGVDESLVVTDRAEAGVDDRIELRIGPAGDTLRQLPNERYLDFAFIDADKTGYPVYWAELVPRMRPGGVIAVDNVLRHGRVIAPQSADDRAIAAFNDDVLADVRVDAVMLPIADGLTLAYVH
ncbi:class I SAM-dependent methyltransferase [Micromonospora craterilacus]|uniref:O-methyltransferase n=1 Tax=Micromonospora craterilacus TaxID=1655439 RepID=UPI0011B67BFC